MKINPKTALIIGLAGFISTNVMARSIPAEIYVPRDATIIKQDRQGNGEFEAEFRLYIEDTNVRELAERVKRHAKKHGFRVVESEVKRDDADLKFKRGDDQELDVSIELKDKGRIEYKADLDLDKS